MLTLLLSCDVDARILLRKNDGSGSPVGFWGKGWNIELFIEEYPDKLHGFW